MAVSRKTAASIIERITYGSSVEEHLKDLYPRLPSEEPLKKRIPAGNDHSEEGLQKRRSLLEEQNITLDQLSGAGPEIAPQDLSNNIENFIGFSRIPVGIVGPLRINGTNAHDDFYVPLATTEGALIASCNRGAYVISQSGGASVICLTESVTRAPCFQFGSLVDSAAFLAWLVPMFETFKGVAQTTTSHGVLNDIRPSVIGREVFINFDYQTGDAAGQNMVTIATEAICNYILENSPVKPAFWTLEGNLSGDKKATMLSFMSARGKKVIAEITVPDKYLRRFLHTSAQQMVDYWQISIMGGSQSGSIGVQGHFANALAAMFIACGQDAACVSEAAVGLTRMDVTDNDSLYVSVTLPNLIVGTVGGGTHLPTARECLEMIGCRGDNSARKFAEICAATALAGEISIIAALACGEFGSAHANYGRKKK